MKQFWSINSEFFSNAVVSKCIFFFGFFLDVFVVKTLQSNQMAPFALEVILEMIHVAPLSNRTMAKRAQDISEDDTWYFHLK